MAERLWLDRARVALRETGPVGLARRSLRVALLRVRDGADTAAKRLLHVEGRARLSAAELAAAARNVELKGRHAGRRAFVIGTGPSLNQTDLSKLSGEITYACNSFMRHPVLELWQPRYYGWMDTGFFANPDLNIPFFEEVRRAVPAAEYFIPAAYMSYVQEHGYLPMSRTYGVPMDGSSADLPWNEIDLAFVPQTPNALQFMLVVALYMGCSPVYLVGADHDWLKNRRTPETTRAGHWDGKNALELSAHHVKADYDDYQDLAAKTVQLWQGYKEIARVAQRRGQQILNATPGSLLDVFPAVDYDSLFEPK